MRFEIKSIRFSFNKYRQNVKVNRAKGLCLADVRGTWLPSVDRQCTGGYALNWLGIRIKYTRITRGRERR